MSTTPLHQVALMKTGVSSPQETLGRLESFEEFLQQYLPPQRAHWSVSERETIIRAVDAWLKRGEVVFTHDATTGDGNGYGNLLWLLRTMHLEQK